MTQQEPDNMAFWNQAAGRILDQPETKRAALIEEIAGGNPKTAQTLRDIVAHREKHPASP